MINTAIEEIERFQRDRGLDTAKYNSVNEHTNIIEELLESISFDVPKNNRRKLSKHINSFYNILEFDNVIINKDSSKEDIVDAYCDIIVFAIGALMKLGYNPEEALLETSKEINSRAGTIINGKFEKDLSKKDKWYKADYTKCKIKDN